MIEIKYGEIMEKGCFLYVCLQVDTACRLCVLMGVDREPKPFIRAVVLVK